MLLAFFWEVGCVDCVLVSGGFQVDAQFYELPPFFCCNFPFIVISYSYAIARMYDTSPIYIFHIYIYSILSNLGGLTNGTNYLFLLYHYSKFISHRNFILFLLLLAITTSSPITMLFLQFFYKIHFNKLAFTSTLKLSNISQHSKKKKRFQFVAQQPTDLVLCLANAY